MRPVSHRVRFVATAATVLCFSSATPCARAQDAPAQGAAVYARYCASCHDQVDARIPTRDALTQMSAARILRTLDFGLMMSVAYPIKRNDREAVSRFLGKGPDETKPPASAFCGPAEAKIMSGSLRQSWSGWSPDFANTRYQNADSAALRAADLGKLELKWAFGFAGDVTALAAPTIIDGTLFVGSAGGIVQALDAKTGCLYWIYQANGPVRSAMGVWRDGQQTSLVFSDQNGWVHGIEARTGASQWKIRVEQHEATRLTGSPVVHDGVAFVPAASWEETRSIDPEYACCTFRGSVSALRVRDGSVVWKTYLVDLPKRTGTTGVGTPTFGPSGAGVWSAPTIDVGRGLLYIATGDNYSHPATETSDAIVALDIKTGGIVWTQQTTPNDVYNSSCGSKGANCPEDAGPDHDFGSSVMLLKSPSGKDILVAGQKSGVVYGLDPDEKGKLIWQTRVGKGGVNGGVQWGMASDGRNVYASVSDVVRPAGGISGPIALGGASLDPAQGGGLSALRLEDGQRIWFAPGAPCNPPRPGCSPAQPGAVTVIDGAVFSGSMDGHVRAFSTVDGKLLWEADTATSYTTVNGIAAKGGSLDGSGPIVVDGIVYVNSGYPRFGGMPGNVLLAFGLPTRAR